MDNKVIVEAKPTPIFNALKTAKMVRLRQVQLENRNSNIRTCFAEPCCSAITTQLSCYSPELAKDIFKTFEDFRPVQQIREEIEKVKPSLAFTT